MKFKYIYTAMIEKQPNDNWFCKEYKSQLQKPHAKKNKLTYYHLKTGAVCKLNTVNLKTTLYYFQKVLSLKYWSTKRV